MARARPPVRIRRWLSSRRCVTPNTRSDATDAWLLLRRRPPDVTPRLGERPDPLGAELTPETRLPDAAERHPRILRCHAVAIDADRARDQLPRHLVRERIVTRPHRRCQSELGRIRGGDRIVDIVISEDR